jgi:hypothetical protein
MQTQRAATTPRLESGRMIALEGLGSATGSLTDGIGRFLSRLADRRRMRRSRPARWSQWAVWSEREEFQKRSEMIRNDARHGIMRIGNI